MEYIDKSVKMIVITGQSGSGKTYLSKKIREQLCNVQIIKTDSFYKDGIFTYFFSKITQGFYDKLISIKKRSLEKEINAILQNKDRNYSYIYNFNKHRSKRVKIEKLSKKISILIIEGVFAHRLDQELISKAFMKIVCVEEKSLCYRRRSKRDIKERGVKRKDMKNNFRIAWNEFDKTSPKNQRNNEYLEIRTSNKKELNKLLAMIK